MEEPTNLMMVTGLLVFDGRVDPQRLRTTLERRLLPLDRFRQRVHESPLGLLPPRWDEDEDFDLDAHLHRVALPAPGDQPALEALVGDLMSTPLDMSKPLWQMHLVDGLRGGGSALLVRIHHCIADGIALVRVLLSLTDQTARGSRAGAATVATATVSKPDFNLPLAEIAGVLMDPLRAMEIAQMGISGAASLQRLITLPADPPTVLKGRLGVTKRAAWSSDLALDAIKAAGRRSDCTVNDFLIGAVTGAIRRYLLDRGEDVAGLEIRAAVPVNLRPIEGPVELGNRFGLIFLPLPVGLEKPADRLAELKRRMDEIKGTPEAVVAFGVLNALGLVPTRFHGNLVEFFGGKATAVMTNVPGPRDPLFLAGRKISSLMFWVPQSGRLGLGVSILSYAGKVRVGIAADAGLVPDPERLVAEFEAEVGALLATPRRAPTGTRRTLNRGGSQAGPKTNTVPPTARKTPDKGVGGSLVGA